MGSGQDIELFCGEMVNHSLGTIWLTCIRPLDLLRYISVDSRTTDDQGLIEFLIPNLASQPMQ